MSIFSLWDKIYSSFYECYGIDLESEWSHKNDYRKFRMLLQNISGGALSNHFKILQTDDKQLSPEQKKYKRKWSSQEASLTDLKNYIKGGAN